MRQIETETSISRGTHTFYFKYLSRILSLQPCDKAAMLGVNKDDKCDNNNIYLYLIHYTTCKYTLLLDSIPLLLLTFIYKRL